MLPLAERLEAGVAGALLVALGVEEGVLVELDALLGVCGAEDATALATVVSAVEEREGGVAARVGADRSRRVVLWAAGQSLHRPLHHEVRIGKGPWDPWTRAEGSRPPLPRSAGR
jgi:hypothetical protein